MKKVFVVFLMISIIFGIGLQGSSNSAIASSTTVQDNTPVLMDDIYREFVLSQLRNHNVNQSTASIFERTENLIVLGVVVILIVLILVFSFSKIKFKDFSLEKSDINSKLNEVIRVNSLPYDQLKCIISDLWEPIYNYMLECINKKTLGYFHNRDNVLLVTAAKLALTDSYKKFKYRLIKNHFYEMEQKMLENEIHRICENFRNNLITETREVSTYIEKYNDIELINEAEFEKLKRMFTEAINSLHYQKDLIAKTCGKSVDELIQETRDIKMIG